MNIHELLKKYENELKVLGTAPVPKHCFWPPQPYTNSPITKKENYLRFGRREKPMFMAIDTDEAMISPALIPDSIARGFCVDNVGLPPEGPGGKDMFGIDWVYVEVAGGSMVRPGNPYLENIEDWETVLKFPNFDEWDWEGSSEANKSLICDQYATNVWIMTGIFERLISFMDFENAAMALIDEDQQEYTLALMNRMAEMYEDMIPRIKKYFDVDILYFHDDWGSQRSPFFSLDTCREFIMPCLKRVVAAAHNCGMLFNFHSCGSIAPLVPAMIEAGVDYWCGQPMNDFKAIYDKYGKDIALGITMTPPPVGAPMEDVVECCQKFLDDYTHNGYAFPVIYEAEFSEDFLPVLYVLSRERFLEAE